MATKQLAFTIQDAQAATGLGRTTLYNLIASGKLDARKSGSRTLIPAASLEQYIADLPSASIGVSCSVASKHRDQAVAGVAASRGDKAGVSGPTRSRVFE